MKILDGIFIDLGGVLDRGEGDGSSWRWVSPNPRHSFNVALISGNTRQEAQTAGSEEGGDCGFDLR